MGALISNAFKSWKTTLTGFIAGFALMAPSLNAFLDNDPATSADVKLILAGLALMAGGAVQRDGDKSSEQVGVK